MSRGPAFLYNPVKRLSSVQPYPPCIDLGSHSPDMNAVDSCCKTWICSAIHPVALRTWSGNGANGLVPASDSRRSFQPLRSSDTIGELAILHAQIRSALY